MSRFKDEYIKSFFNNIKLKNIDSLKKSLKVAKEIRNNIIHSPFILDKNHFSKIIKEVSFVKPPKNDKEATKCFLKI